MVVRSRDKTHFYSHAFSSFAREVAEFLLRAWPSIIRECRAMLGSELFCQTVTYRNLRQAGVPLQQIGMNVKMQIDNPVSKTVPGP